MKRSVFIIEDDQKFMGEIKEALGQINPDFDIREFADLKAFVGWLQIIVNKTKNKAAAPPPVVEAVPVDPNAAPVDGADAAPPPAEAPAAVGGEDIEIGLLICRSEFLKSKGFNLLRKTRDYFILHKIASKENPTVFVLTAFDTDNFDFSKYENEIVSNIIFKPFDKLILREHLRIALSGSKPDSSGEIYKQKTKSKVEMLKDVHIESISEMGFTSISDREISPGAQAKYYSKLFQAGALSSVHARAVSCKPIAANPGHFDCEFNFVNLLNQQISAIRKTIKGDKSHVTKTIKVTKEVPKYVYNFLTLSPHGVTSMKANIERVFSNVKFTEYEDFIGFAMDLDPGAKSLGGEKSKEKFLPFPTLGKIIFDLKMNKVLALEPPAAETAAVLGTPLKKFLETEGLLHQKIHPDDRNKWIALCKSQLKTGSPPVICKFKSADDRLAFIKVISLQPLKHEKLGEVLVLELAECTEQEKTAYLQSLSRLPAVIDALFIDALFLGENYTERWNMILSLIAERNKKANAGPAKLIVITDKPINSDDVLARQAPITDIFNRPLDGPYTNKKIKTLFELLLLKEEDMDFSSVVNKTLVKVAQPVISEEVAETGLSLMYHRPIPVGSFRKVCLWLPHEIGLPEFLASCNIVEEVEVEVDKKKVKSYLCHFIFFGVRDTSLKHIRRWIKDYYVLSKEQEGG